MRLAGMNRSPSTRRDGAMIRSSHFMFSVTLFPDA
jgi:hypothetical protein